MIQTSEPAARIGGAQIPLLLLALLVPLASTNTTLLGASIPLTMDTLRIMKWVVVAVLVLVAVVMWGREALARRRVVLWDGVFWILLALLGIAVVSTATSVNLPSAVFGSYAYRQGLLMIAMLMTVTFLTVQLFSDRDGRRALAAAVVIGGGVVAGYGLVQVAGWDPASWGAPDWALARGFSTLGNPDNYGGYLIFPAAIAFGLAVSERRAGIRIAWWAAFTLTAVALLLCQVRGAWLGLLVAGIVGGAYVWRTRTRFQRVDLIALGLALVLLVGAGLLVSDSIVYRVTDMFSGQRDAGSGRLPLWETGVRAAGAFPLLGTGPDSFRYGFYRARGTDQEVTGGYRAIADDAHSLPIMIAATLGVPALVVAAAFFILVVLRAGTGLFAARREAGFDIGGAWFAAVIGYTVYLFFGPSSITTSAMAALGLGVLIGVRTLTAREPSRAALGWAVAGLATVALVTAATGLFTLSADHEYVQALSLDRAEALPRVNTAVSRSPWTYEYRAARAAFLAEAARESDAPRVEDAAAAAVDAYEDLVRFAPSEYLTYIRLARLMLDIPALGEQGSEAALDAAARAIDVYPSGLEARTIGAIACLRLGRYEDARSLLVDDWDADPDYADPMAAYGFALAALGETDSAISVADALEENHPDDSRLSDLRAAIEKTRGSAR